MKKPVNYRLLSDGTQPYLALDAVGLTFSGGICEKNGLYLGVVEGNNSTINAFLSSNQFSMVDLTVQQAIDYYDSCLPAVITYPPQPTRQEMIDSVSVQFV